VATLGRPDGQAWALRQRAVGRAEGLWGARPAWLKRLGYTGTVGEALAAEHGRSFRDFEEYRTYMLHIDAEGNCMWFHQVRYRPRVTRVYEGKREGLNDRADAAIRMQ
jgi:hypothetical protein